MRAISVLIRDDGMSTRVCLAITPLRIRVSMSAIGSVMLTSKRPRLPAALRDARDVSLERQLAEAETAERKLPHVGARAAAEAAAVAQPDLELRYLLLFGDLGGWYP